MTSPTAAKINFHRSSEIQGKQSKPGFRDLQARMDTTPNSGAVIHTCTGMTGQKCVHWILKADQTQAAVTPQQNFTANEDRCCHCQLVFQNVF